MRYIILIALFISKQLAGQILYNPDPYLIEISIYGQDFSKKQVLDNKIKKVTISEYKLKKSGKQGRKIKLSNYKSYNEFGNPTDFHSEFKYDVIWWSRFKQKLGLENKWISIHQIRFLYNQEQFLVHLTEQESNKSRSETKFNEIHFNYDANKNLINQVVNQRTIYSPRLIPIKKEVLDSNGWNISFVYDSLNNKKIVYTYEYYFSFDSLQERFDTVYIKNNNAKTIVEKPASRNIKLDTLGRIIESIALNRVGCNGGISYNSEIQNIENPKDIISKYYYDKDGNNYRIESKYRSGESTETIVMKYYENNLLKSISNENYGRIKVFQYEYY
jgi:hypothetical protein